MEALWQKYKSRNVQVFIINVKESVEVATRWADKLKLTFPVLMDTDGKVAASYAPPDLLPDLARDEVSIGRDEPSRYSGARTQTVFPLSR